ncbi:MAG: carbohydrate kinase [Alphaproteobacteria bacterium]|nr:MAG: carbohydrate kinase [Alphaproteobacteria bacterium]
MSNLSKTEKAILELIANNPYVGQSEIADKIGFARSTVAVQITQLVSKGYLLGRGYILPSPQKITCIGGIAYNRKYALDISPILGTSNPAISSQNHGGVVRNIAENLARLGVDVSLISIVGEDYSGKELLAFLRNLGVDVSQVSVSHNAPTAEYVAIFDNENELVFGLSSMEILDQMTSAKIERSWSHLSSSDWVVLDCNLPADTIETVLQLKQKGAFKVAVDTVSVSKAKRLFDDLSNIDLLFTNRAEATAILDLDPTAPEQRLEDIAALLRDRGAKGVIITDGAAGHVVDMDESRFRTPAIPVTVANVSGAGDALVAGLLFKLRTGASIRESSQTGALLSALTVESVMEVAQDLSVDRLNEYADSTL